MEKKRETPWMQGTRHAAKRDDEKRLSFIHARCSARDKAAWVKQAQKENMKLTEWVVKVLNNNINLC